MESSPADVGGSCMALEGSMVVPAFGNSFSGFQLAGFVGRGVAWLFCYAWELGLRF